MDKRLKYLNTSFCFLFLLSLLFPQDRGGIARDMKSTNIEQFYISVAPEASTTNSDEIVLKTYIMIPSYAFQFVKENNAFKASFEARIFLLDADGQQIDQITTNQTLTAADYMETVSQSNWYFIDHIFNVQPEQYKIVCELLDGDTHKSGVKEIELDLTDYNSDFILFPPQVMNYYKSTWQGEKKLLPSYRNEVKFQQSQIPVHISGKVSQQDFTVKIVLTSPDGDTIAFLEESFANTNRFFNGQFLLPVEEISSLRASLNVSLIQNYQQSDRLIELLIKRPGVSTLVRDVEEALDQMKYILTSEERNELSNIRKKDLEEFFYKLWQKRDPTSGTSTNELMDQYYQRVNYSNEHFTNIVPGWRMDMGMIYILFGPPDDIEQSFMNSNRNSIHTWHYYRINRSFTFYDENGFGDFRLSTPYFYGRAW